jgi:enoyl-CoA hydratase/carnithine racemase
MIKQCGDDPKVGALLITGAGSAFCAGGDVKGMGTMLPEPRSRSSSALRTCEQNSAP